MRVAVVGHVEWIEFVRVDHLPAPGEIVHALDAWEEPGGGGAVAAVQLAKLAGAGALYTAFGDDAIGRRSASALRELGVTVHATPRRSPHRRGFVHLDAEGERTITVIGDRLGPLGADDLPWDELATTDAVYLTAGDADAIRRARAARTLVATTRGLEGLVDAEVELDALVSSAKDPGERYERGWLRPEPRLLIRTEGADGGSWETRDGERGRWDATPPPGPTVDVYGCGDSFAAGVTYGLGAGLPIAAAIELGARCGAACASGRGPYAGQLDQVG